MRRRLSKEHLSLGQWLAALLTGFATATVFLDHHFYALAWLMFVPLLLGCHNATSGQCYRLSFLSGFVAFALGTYWLVSFTQLSKGLSWWPSLLLSAVVWCYCAHLFVLLVLGFRFLVRHTGIHPVLLFPLLLTTLTSAYPMLFAMRLGDTQVLFSTALQAIDMFGVHGLDAIIALVNIMVLQVTLVLMRWGDRQSSLYSETSADNPWIKHSKQSSLVWSAAIVVLIAWFLYGNIKLSHWRAVTNSSKSIFVGLVQPNEKPQLGKSIRHPGFNLSYPPEMALTETLVEAGAQLVVWPEAQSKEVLNNGFVRQSYQNTLTQLDTDLVFQDTQVLRSKQAKHQFNTAVLISTNNAEAPQAAITATYRKRKLIPLGEKVPWFGKDTYIGQQLATFIGPFLNEISPGTTHSLLASHGLNMVPLICYETTFPGFVANAVQELRRNSSESNTPVPNALIGLSNDGWFGSSHQPYQHILTSALRAVENRLPLLHAVNNGPSIIVAPSGELLFISDFQKAGGFLSSMPILSSVEPTFYSQHPRLFTNTVYGLLAFCFLIALWRCLVSSKQSKLA